jgi:hypothetical protein
MALGGRMSKDTPKLSDEDKAGIGTAYRFVQEVVKQALGAGPQDRIDAAVIFERVAEVDPKYLMVALVGELASLASFSRALNDLLLYSYIRMFDSNLFQRYTQAGRGVPDTNWRINLAILSGLQISDDTSWGKQPGEQNPELRQRLIAHLEFMVESNALVDMRADGQVAARVGEVIVPSIAEFTKKHRVIPVLPHGETYINLEQVKLEDDADGWTAKVVVPESITFLSIEGHGDQAAAAGN